MNLVDELKELYKTIPPSNCKGLCHWTCGPIIFSDTEWSLLDQNAQKEHRYNIDESSLHVKTRERQFHTGKPVTGKACPYLTSDNKCSIYEQRPFICRFYGTTSDPLNKCPHGCEAVLSTEKGYNILTKYFDLIKKEVDVNNASFLQGRNL